MFAWPHLPRGNLGHGLGRQIYRGGILGFFLMKVGYLEKKLKLKRRKVDKICYSGKKPA